METSLGLALCKHVERLWALAPQLTGPALAASPNPVKLGLRAIEQYVVVGDDSHFEVAPLVAPCADAGAGEVCATEVHERAVDGDEFQVHTWAVAHFEARSESFL